MLGQEMDSLADLISFGVAPATLAFTLGLRKPLDLVCLLLFVSGGLARLARFNATVALVPSDANGKSKYFEGLPIPSSLFLTSMMAYWVKAGYHVLGQKIGGDVPFGVKTLWGKAGGSGDVHVAALIFAVWAAAMVSKTLRVSSSSHEYRWSALMSRYRSCKRARTRKRKSYEFLACNIGTYMITKLVQHTCRCSHGDSSKCILLAPAGAIQWL